jgi:hypothetical protein
MRRFRLRQTVEKNFHISRPAVAGVSRVLADFVWCVALGGKRSSPHEYDAGPGQGKTDRQQLGPLSKMVGCARSATAPSRSLRSRYHSRNPNRLLRSAPRSIKALRPCLSGKFCLPLVCRFLAGAKPDAALSDRAGNILLASTLRKWMQRSPLDVRHGLSSEGAAYSYRNSAGAEQLSRRTGISSAKPRRARPFLSRSGSGGCGLQLAGAQRASVGARDVQARYFRIDDYLVPALVTG